MTSDYIPEALQIEILARLPLESLLRFKSVCKSWYSFITNPSFITTHLNQTISIDNKKTKTLLIRYFDRNEKKERYTLGRDDETFGEQFSELEFPFKSSIGYFRIVGSCLGLLCLSDDLFSSMENVVLWNPSIRKSVEIHLPSKPDWPHMIVLGFGVCPVTHDPKVVKIVYVKDLSHIYKAPPEVEVYAVSSGTWRRACSNAPPYYMVEFTWSQAFVNGAIHWIAYDKRVEGGYLNLIVSFDLVDEKFHDLLLPDSLACGLLSNLSITVHRDSLAMLEYDRQIETASCCIWVMIECGVLESWTKLFTINLPGALMRTIGFRTNGDAILLLKNNELVSYEPNSRDIKNVGIFGNIRSFFVDEYMETLFLLNVQSGLPELQLNYRDTCTCNNGENRVEE